jgi:hypothetical protein
MITPETVQTWLAEQATPLLVIGTALILGFAILYFSARGRRAKMVSRRSGLTEDTFVEDLIPFGFDPQVARATYRYLQERQNISFPILAMDALDEDLGLDSEDVTQTIRELLDLTGREHLPGLLHSPLVSVEDLVRYVQASPRKSQSTAVA